MNQPPVERAGLNFDNVPPATPHEQRVVANEILDPKRRIRQHQTIVGPDEELAIPIDMQPLLVVDRERRMLVPLSDGMIAKVALMSAVEGSTDIKSNKWLDINSIEEDIADGKMKLLTQLEIYDGRRAPQELDAILGNPVVAKLELPKNNIRDIYEFHRLLSDLEDRSIIIKDLGNGDYYTDEQMEERTHLVFQPSGKPLPDGKVDIAFFDTSVKPDNTDFDIVANSFSKHLREVALEQRDSRGVWVIDEGQVILCGAGMMFGLKQGEIPKSACAVVTTMSPLQPQPVNDSLRVHQLSNGLKQHVVKIRDNPHLALPGEQSNRERLRLVGSGDEGDDMESTVKAIDASLDDASNLAPTRGRVLVDIDQEEGWDKPVETADPDDQTTKSRRFSLRRKAQ